MTSFSEQLAIPRGVTALIGSGGKTTLLYRLAQELSACGTVIVTTTTHIFRPTHLPFAETAARVEGIVCLGTPCENGKLTAPCQSFAELRTLADFVLVEADGAARKPLKAHAPHEPVIPPQTARTVTVVGASGIGGKISEVVHRPERFSALSGEAEIATAQAVARVLEAERLSECVLINQVDTPEALEAARAVASGLTCPTAAAALQKGEFLCWF